MSCQWHLDKMGKKRRTIRDIEFAPPYLKEFQLLPLFHSPNLTTWMALSSYTIRERKDAMGRGYGVGTIFHGGVDYSGIRGTRFNCLHPSFEMKFLSGHCSKVAMEYPFIKSAVSNGIPYPSPMDVFSYCIRRCNIKVMFFQTFDTFLTGWVQGRHKNQLPFDLLQIIMEYYMGQDGEITFNANGMYVLPSNPNNDSHGMGYFYY